MTARSAATADPRLQRLLGGPELAAVRQRLRRHFERAGADAGAAADAAATRLRVDALDPAAHHALCQLTGRASHPARSMTLDLVDLDARLRQAGLADSLRDALERLEGPIVAHAQLRRELQAQWDARVTGIDAGPLLRAWLDGAPAARALLKRVARDPRRGEVLLLAADAVLARLPATGMPRSQLAADTLGDAHGLDAGRPVAALVLAAWRWHERVAASGAEGDADAGEGQEEGGASNVATDAGAERLREVWARAGVLVSELARPVLFLNLPMPADAGYTWTPGEPGYLSLRQLLRRPPAWPVAGRRIHVCENPDIVAIAADRLGPASAPLLCTDGMPAAAQRVLLDQLAASGARLYYHGDYDWPGIGIGNFVMRTWQAESWRYGATEYLAAVGQTRQRPRDLDTARIEALWDGALATAMDESGLAIAEEAVVDDLLADLGRQDG